MQEIDGQRGLVGGLLRFQAAGSRFDPHVVHSLLLSFFTKKITALHVHVRCKVK